LGGGGANPNVKRIIVDIKDLCLSNVDILKDEQGNQKPVIAFSKHLCGSATDLTLKCLANYAEDQNANNNNR
jgi:tRNA:m4X modification enzyme